MKVIFIMLMLIMAMHCYAETAWDKITTPGQSQIQGGGSATNNNQTISGSGGKQGCCSKHNGVTDKCSNGKIICSDGTESGCVCNN